MFIEGRLISVSITIFQLYHSLFGLRRQLDFLLLHFILLSKLPQSSKQMGVQIDLISVYNRLIEFRSITI